MCSKSSNARNYSFLFTKFGNKKERVNYNCIIIGGWEVEFCLVVKIYPPNTEIFHQNLLEAKF